MNISILILALSSGALAGVISACVVLACALAGIIAFAVVRYRRSVAAPQSKKKAPAAPAERPPKPVRTKRAPIPAEERPASKPLPKPVAPAFAEEPHAEVPAEEGAEEPASASAEEAETPVAGGEVVHALDTDLILEGETEEGARAYDVQKRRFMFVRFNRSYTARLIQAQESVKEYYEELKNELFSYEGVKSRIGWKGENFRKGRTNIARLRVRGKLLCLYLSLDPAQYLESKYKVEDVSDVSANEEVPTLYRIKNDRRLRYAKELIAAAMEKAGVPQAGGEHVPYAKQLPYESTDALIKRDLIRLVEFDDIAEAAATAPAPAPVPAPKATVKAAEAHVLMEDAVARQFIEEESAEPVPRIKNGRMGIINVDTLSEFFKDGERVTLEEIRRRVPFFDRRATAVKVLARGSIDKKLTVVADDFSLDAVKMIVLTGGHAVHTAGNK